MSGTSSLARCQIRADFWCSATSLYEWIMSMARRRNMVGSRQGAGTVLARMLESTVVGGLLFLLPLVLVALLLGHAIRLAGKLSKPITDTLQVDAVIGSGGEEVLAILMLVAVSI